MLDEKIRKLQSLISDNVQITMRVNIQRYDGAGGEVVLQDQNDSYHWTSFRGKTLDEALERAVSKLEHPEKDYLDFKGGLWRADQSSVFSERHIKTFRRRLEGS